MWGNEDTLIPDDPSGRTLFELCILHWVEHSWLVLMYSTMLMRWIPYIIEAAVNIFKLTYFIKGN